MAQREPIVLIDGRPSVLPAGDTLRGAAGGGGGELIMGIIGKKLRGLQGGMVAFMCPGCNELHQITVRPAQSPSWDYNGNPDAPTFSPSVLCRTHEWRPPVTQENLDEWKRKPWPQERVEIVCHSFVTDGRIQFLGDCTHALAGQTVDLPDIAD